MVTARTLFAGSIALHAMITAIIGLLSLGAIPSVCGDVTYNTGGQSGVNRPTRREPHVRVR